MGSSQRLAAVAAVSHAKHYYNHTQPVVTHTETVHYNVNVFFVSATLCGVLVAVCAACWRRSPAANKPDEVLECRGVYTVSADARLQVMEDLPGPPPAYESVVEGATDPKPCHTLQVMEDLPGPPPAYESVVEGATDPKPCHTLQEVITEPCTRCESGRNDGGLPSYEAAVLLRDTKL